MTGQGLPYLFLRMDDRIFIIARSQCSAMSNRVKNPTKREHLLLDKCFQLLDNQDHRIDPDPQERRSNRMMKSIDTAQMNFLLASAFWGLFWGILTWSSQWLIADRGIFRMIWYAGNLLSVFFYPCLAAYLLYKRTCLWVNAVLFSGAGTILSIMAFYSIRAIPGKSWIGVGIGLLGILMVVQLLIPRMVQVPLVGKEKESPSWKGLMQASLVDFVLFGFLRDA